MSVALSTVIFRPMLQLGCLSASATWGMQGTYRVRPQPSNATKCNDLCANQPLTQDVALFASLTLCMDGQQ